MSLNAKEDRQRLMTPGVEADTSTALHAAPANPALAEVTSFAGARDDVDDKVEDDTTPTPVERRAAATAKPPSSLLDYRLVRVSSQLEGETPADDETASPVVGWSAAQPGAESIRRDISAQGAVPSRRLSQALLVLLALSLVSVMCIGAIFAL